MGKEKVYYFLNLAMAFTLIVTAVAGITIGIKGSSNHVLLGIHATFAIITVCLVFIHVILHKDWIVFLSKKIFGKKIK